MSSGHGHRPLTLVLLVRSTSVLGAPKVYAYRLCSLILYKAFTEVVDQAVVVIGTGKVESLRSLPATCIPSLPAARLIFFGLTNFP